MFKNLDQLRPERPHHPRAASILYSLVIVTTIIVTAGTMSASFIRASQRNHDLFRSTQAYYAGRAAMEAGIAEAGSQGVGFEEGNSSAINWPGVSSGGEYEIYSRSKKMDWDDPTPALCNLTSPENCFVVPMPGTGSAGAENLMGPGGEGCDFEEQDAGWNSDTAQGNSSWLDALNDNCNWNTIAYQENVTVPLYYHDASCAGNLCNPFRNVLSNLLIRVRTPNGESLSATDMDQVVVNWEISGDCDTTGDSMGDASCYMVPSYFPTGTDSAISFNDLNGANGPNDYLLVDGASSVFDSPISIAGFPPFPDVPPVNFLTLGPPAEIMEPNLRLSVISPLTNGSGDRIPYLEYQVLTNVPVADNKVIYTSIGLSQGRQGVYFREIQASQTLESNSVVNFVVQN
jgi:hypothetical protein